MMSLRRAARPGRRRRVSFGPLALGLALLVAACASGSALFHQRPDARELAAVWVDADKATPTDTVAWRFDPNGADWTLDIRVVRNSTGRATAEQRVKRYGYWYLQGALADTTRRALCFKARPRDGGTCYPFQLDTFPESAPDGIRRRRLVVLGYVGQRHARSRVLLERLP